MVHKYFFFISIIIVFIFSCKKFDEGPLLSMQSREERIDKTWEVKRYYVEDIDSTKSLNEYFTLIKIDSNNGKYTPVYWYDSETGGSVSLYLSKKLILFYEPINFYGVSNKKHLFFGYFEIKRLTKEELILETYNQEKNLRIELKSTNKDVFDY